MTAELLRKPDAAEFNATLSAVLYIASLTNELARLASSHGLDTLAYLLDMARIEADQVSKTWQGDPRERNR